MLVKVLRSMALIDLLHAAQKKKKGYVKNTFAYGLKGLVRACVNEAVAFQLMIDVFVKRSLPGLYFCFKLKGTAFVCWHKSLVTSFCIVDCVYKAPVDSTNNGPNNEHFIVEIVVCFFVVMFTFFILNSKPWTEDNIYRKWIYINESQLSVAVDNDVDINETLFLFHVPATYSLCNWNNKATFCCALHPKTH